VGIAKDSSLPFWEISPYRKCVTFSPDYS